MSAKIVAKILKVDPQKIATEASLLLPACELLRRDEVVAFPTETVYGLGGNALSEAAVAKIFLAKGFFFFFSLTDHQVDLKITP